MIHAVGLGNRENQFQSDSGITMPSMGFIYLISNVSVPIGMVVMAEAKADLPDGSTAGVFHDGPPIEGEFVLAAFYGFDETKGKNAAIDGIEFFFEGVFLHGVSLLGTVVDANGGRGQVKGLGHLLG